MMNVFMNIKVLNPSNSKMFMGSTRKVSHCDSVIKISIRLSLWRWLTLNPTHKIFSLWHQPTESKSLALSLTHTTYSFCGFSLQNPSFWHCPLQTHNINSQSLWHQPTVYNLQVALSLIDTQYPESVASAYSIASPQV